MLNMTWPQAKAAGKHAASVAAGAVGMAVALHFISPQQATDANADVQQLVTGLEQVGTALAGLVAIVTPMYTAWRAANNASPTHQAASLVKEVPGTIVVTTPEIAAAVPSAAVVSNVDVQTIPTGAKT